MGIGIQQELFIPIKTTRTSRKRDLHQRQDGEEEDASSCHTPKSSSKSNPPPRCPPPPTKPPPVRRKFSSVQPPKLGFFQVPEDLASVFRLITPPNNKIITSS